MAVPKRGPIPLYCGAIEPARARKRGVPAKFRLCDRTTHRTPSPRRLRPSAAAAASPPPSGRVIAASRGELCRFHPDADSVERR